MESVSIQIPANAEPGDQLSFTVNGEEMEIEIPVGSVAGDVLEIQLQKTNEMGSEKEGGESTSVSMVTGEMLTINTSAHDDGQSDDLGSSDGTYAMIWPAARVLVDYINSSQFREIVEGARVNSVLELGSGTGLVGLAFAHVLSQLQEKRMTVTLTDVPSAIPLLKLNSSKNETLMHPNTSVSTQPLVWHTSPVPSGNAHLDWIIGSDLLYNTTSIPALAATVSRLASPSTRILLSVRWRKPDIERAFFEQLSDRVDWRLLDGASSLNWTDYGNPAIGASNAYFTQTMVGVQGKPKPLSEITEEDMEAMSKAEFDAFERSQIQIYVGEVKNASSRQSEPNIKRQRRI